MAADLKPGPARRLLAGAGVVLAVMAVHACVADQLASRVQSWAAEQAMPPRIAVTYVREMMLAAAPTVAPARPKVAPPRRRAAARAEPAPPPPEPPETPPADMPVEEPAPVAKPAPIEAAVAEVLPPEPAASQAGPPFEWPVSTRMRYLLTGNYQGEVHGQAQVEWIRVGSHYQVHLDVVVGPSFAPLGSRRMSSDGDITPEGLAPRRYDQETKLAFNDARYAMVRFEGDKVLLATGQEIPRWPGVQDTASQFVQLSWMFATRPEQLRVGNTVEIPLAMPRNLTSWVYDVVAEETLYTTFGEVQAFHLKPRRVARAGGDLTTEIWIAPQLRHLPVRFLIHQDAETYFDLMLDRRPELAAP